jgi:hypothetical protein
MKSKFVAFFFFTFSALSAQNMVDMPSYLKNPMDSTTQVLFEESLQGFFQEIVKGDISEKWLHPKRAKLMRNQLQKLIDYEQRKDSTAKAFKDKKLINVYPLSKNEYSLLISIHYQQQSSDPILLYLLHFIATKTENAFQFSLPLDYMTSNWKKQEVGNITYYSSSSLYLERAKLFDRKNTEIATKLGVQPEKFDFFMTQNYQQVQNLLGFDYSLPANGIYREGYGVVANTIFATMGNEDFSHDIFHYYSGKINSSENRNWITEEGVAYLWGNAYYTDAKGEIPNHQRLVEELKEYLVINPKTDLYELFINNSEIFKGIAPELSVRSTISGILVREIERKFGVKGVLQLVNAGSKNRLNNYLKVTEKLLGINEENFNMELSKLLSNMP